MKIVHAGLLVLLAALSLFSTTSIVIAHEAKGWLVVSHFTGDLQLDTDHSASQWSSGREVNVASPGGQEISAVALNNGTHIYFHVRSPDHTQDQNDGIAIFFEGAGVNGSDDVWLWTTDSSLDFGAGVVAAARLSEDYWNVALGRSLAAQAQGTANLTVGESKEAFVKFAAWDGAQGQNFDEIDPDSLVHLNLYILPFIDYYPRDSFVWLPILGLGLLFFTYKELKTSGWRKKD